jgi:hypothetical protein
VARGDRYTLLLRYGNMTMMLGLLPIICHFWSWSFSEIHFPRLQSHTIQQFPRRLQLPSTDIISFNQLAPTPGGSILVSNFGALTQSGLVTDDKKQRIMEHTRTTGLPCTHWPLLGSQVAYVDSMASQFHFIFTQTLLKSRLLLCPQPQPPKQSQNDFCSRP